MQFHACGKFTLLEISTVISRIKLQFYKIKIEFQENQLFFSNFKKLFLNFQLESVQYSEILKAILKLQTMY